MTINPDAYRRMEAHEADEALRRMTAEDSIAIGEAILTSKFDATIGTTPPLKDIP